MRSIVSHPKNKTLPTQITAPTSQPEKIVYRHGNIDRDLRASINLKSKRISRFEPSVAKVTRKHEHIPVKTAPKAVSEDRIFVAKQSPPITFKREITKDTSASLFETALKNSISHKSKQISTTRKNKKASKHLIKVATGLAVTLLFIGAINYISQPNKEIKSASNVAGFAASMPTYKPTGYSLVKVIQAEYGSVVLNYASNTENSGYYISQVKSDVTDSNIENQVLGSNSEKFTTIVGNTKVVIQNGTNASWTQNGILFSLVGDKPLSTQQITNIVASLKQ